MRVILDTASKNNLKRSIPFKSIAKEKLVCSMSQV